VHAKEEGRLPSATLQRRNTQLGNQFTRLGQQVHHFGHRIGKDDPRRPASAGFKIEEVTPIGCIPEPAAIGALDPKAVTIATNTGRLDAKGFVIAPGGGSVLSMAPGRSAALKLLGGETGHSIMLFEETAPAGTETTFHLHRDEVA
jgi:hypothetical protein